MFAQLRVWFLALLMVWALSHASVFGGSGEPAARELSPAEKTRKTLDQSMNLDFTGRSLQEVVLHLREKIRVNIVLDMSAAQQVGLAGDENNGTGFPVAITLKSERPGKIRTAIQRMLNPYNLTYVILDDTVLITTEESGLNRQLRQRVSVNLANVPFSAVLSDLARNTALNLIIDPRLGKGQADFKISLQLDDAALETAVRLLAEMASLKSVRMGNVLFITDQSRAKQLRQEDPPLVIPGVVPSVLLRDGGG